MKNREQLIIAALILGVMVMGCSMLKQDGPAAPNSNTASANTTTANTAVTDGPTSLFTPGSNAKDDLEKIADRFMALSSFRSTMKGTGKNPFNSVVDFIAPDKFQIRSDLPNGKSMEMRIIGKDTYMNANGNWQKVPIDVGSQIPNFRETFTRDEINRFKEIEYAGEDQVDGTPAYLYKYSGAAMKGGSAYTSKTWVSKTSGLPLKIIANYETGDLKTMEIAYDYTTKITIEAPK